MNVMDLHILGSNFKRQYVKVHHIYTTTIPRNTYILTIWLSYTTQAVKKWLIWFYCVLLWFQSLKMVSWGPKHAGILSLCIFFLVQLREAATFRSTTVLTLSMGSTQSSSEMW